MNQEQQRIAIAEACGWTEFGDKVRFANTGNSFTQREYWMKGGVDPETGSFKELPDYLNDLNAMHEAEKLLIRIYEPPSAHKDYDTKLWAKMRDDGLELNGYTWHATAKQRAEAFLKTLNLWEEE